MRYRCLTCESSVITLGRLRGFRMADHQCPCGGDLAKGSGRGDLPTQYAKPRDLVKGEDPRGLKRSHRHAIPRQG